MKLYKFIRSIAALLFVLLLSINPLPDNFCYAETGSCILNRDNLQKTGFDITKSESARGSTFNEVYRYFGDVNNDGKLNMLDVISMQRYVAKLIDLNSNDKIAADLNNNGAVNMRDIVMLQEYIAHLKSSFPVGTLFRII